jgi:hypothetical protein
LQQRFGTPSNILQRPQEASQNDQAPISLHLVDDLPALWPFRWSEEGYQLVCNDQGISISALTTTGVFYGVQTLLQALSVSEQQQGLCLPHTQVGVLRPRMRIQQSSNAQHASMYCCVQRYCDCQGFKCT